MELTYYVEQLKFQMTGDVLESELDDSGYSKIVNMALQEVSRYYNSTKLVEAKADSCIDLKKLEKEKHIKINTVTNIFRTQGVGTSSERRTYDPMSLAQWNVGNNYGGLVGTNKWIYNYAAYNTTLQIYNTASTDLAFREDKLDRKLYINYSTDKSGNITIEYIPRLEHVDELQSDYWIDILLKLSLAYTKITIGRIRTRFTQSNALWTQDGEKLLAEGTEELKSLQERLRTQSTFFLPVD